MKKVIIIMSITIFIMGSIYGQNIASYECVGSDRLELVVNLPYNSTSNYAIVKLDDCDQELLRVCSREGDNLSTTIILESAANDPFECPSEFTGKITIYNSSYYEISTTTFVDEEPVNPNDLMPSSSVVGFCNKKIKDMLSKAIGSGTLNASTCPQWKGDCGIDGAIWREGRLIGSQHDNLDNTPGIKIDLRKESVLTDEYKVCNIGANGWCDYVFDNNYDLMTLPKVSEFIQEHKRLPNMPSESEVVKNEGFVLDDIIVRQQEKIEELYLHVIEVDEKLSKLTGEGSTIKEFKENYRYGLVESTDLKLNREQTKEENAPLALDLPCVPIDCEGLTSEGSAQMRDLVFDVIPNSKCKKWTDSGCQGSSVLRKRLGPVGLGTKIIPNGFNLAVDGDVIFGELYILLCSEWSWCDYVFEEEYEIPNLPSTKKFISENKRLPNIPSTETLISDGGLLIKQITILQQEKIEELYIHLFELNNRLINYKKNNNE